MKNQPLIATICMVLCLTACNQNQAPKNFGFEKIPSTKSGLQFSNDLDEYKMKSIFNYVNAYTGGGVAVGDINNDGLQDIYLTANMSSSKLFLNKGDMEFEDITESSGTMTTGWSSAVTMADVNNDGWLDIYVCRSYHDNPEDRMNLLFINNKNGTFTEMATEYGINDENYSVGASFFDYDKDGDLDLVVANHPRFRNIPMQIHYDNWIDPPLKFSNRLFRNDGSKFTEVTEEAGVMSYGFSLAVLTTDFNVDGWPDIVITVDHEEPDIFFRNNGDGTFTNVLDEVTNQTSRSSMGIDAGDINHDIYPDLFVAEMLSEDHYREKIGMSMQTVKRFQFIIDTMRYKYYQMHNFMYLNNGNGSFSEISQMAGVHKSDWSWATLFMDFDNDGWQDMFITNGLYRDVFNNDRMKKLDSVMLSLNNDLDKMNRAAEEYSRNSPHLSAENYLFKNNGDLTFRKYADIAGLTDTTVSTGAAYADLDNDGDLDLIVCNIGEEVLLYRNNSNPENKYLRVDFKYDPKMTAFGSKVNIYYNDDFQSRELLTTRGFLSACEPVVHFGVGKVATIDKVEIVWPDGKMQVLNNVKTGTTLTVEYKNADQRFSPPKSKSIVRELSPEETGVDYVQKENKYFDYDDQVLLPHKMSEYGPFTTIGDVNGDGLDDFYIGSPHQQAGAMYIQQENGKFVAANQQVFEADKHHEDGHSLFFDADGDGDLDLVVTSTGYEFDENDPIFQPRLYLNDGKGNFKRAPNAFPKFHFPASCIEAFDFDGDGDLDLFIGGHLVPKKYPLAGTSGLFINNGKGKFTDKIDEISPDLKRFGMIKDAMWTDINHDGKNDLIVVGEWTPISFWIQTDGKLENKTEDFFETPLTGWWNCIEKADLTGNGLDDYIFGNLGKNYKYKASMEKPFVVYAKDFDESGTCDIVLGAFYGDVMYPLRGRSCSSEQIPHIKTKFPTFDEYARADIHDVYGEDLNTAVNYEANLFASIVLYQTEAGKYTFELLPLEAQIAPVNGIVVMDVNNDNLKDLIIAGNLYQSEIETGRADSGTGKILLNKGDRTFKALSVYETGLFLNHDVKSLQLIRLGKDKKPTLLVGNNQEACQLILMETTSPDI